MLHFSGKFFYTFFFPTLSIKSFLINFRYFTEIVVILYLTASCSIHILFVAENLKGIIEEVSQKKFQLRMYIMMTFLPFFPVNYRPNWKLIDIMCNMTNYIAIPTFACIIYYACIKLPNLPQRNVTFTCENSWFAYGITMFVLDSFTIVKT